MNSNAKLILLFFLSALLFLSIRVEADFLDYYPNIKPLNDYAYNFKNYFKQVKKNIFIVRERNIFKSPEEILKYTQKNYINIAIIPLKTLRKLDINNNLIPLINKAFQIKNNSLSYSELIPLRLELNKYGIFIFNILPGSRYFLFTSFKSLKKDKLSIAVLNDYFLKKFKKLFPNSLYFGGDAADINRFVKSGIFNSVVMSSVDYSISNVSFKYAYNFGLEREKYCIIANLNYWNKQSETVKNIIWSFISKYDKIFLLDIKRFQDKVLNKLKVKNLLW